MDSGMISKIQKAKQYAEEPERVVITAMEAEIRGDHTTHRVRYANGVWECGCSFYKQRHLCSHTMAMERLLEPMLKQASEPADLS